MWHEGLLIGCEDGASIASTQPRQALKPDARPCAAAVLQILPCSQLLQDTAGPSQPIRAGLVQHMSSRLSSAGQLASWSEAAATSTATRALQGLKCMPCFVKVTAGAAVNIPDAATRARWAVSVVLSVDVQLCTGELLYRPHARPQVNS
jgi:hypothetical protein